MVDQVLFRYKEYVQLWQTGGLAPNTNTPMIQYDTPIYKGATNVIDFVVRNNDRKPVNLVGSQLVALIQRVENPTPLVRSKNPPMAQILLKKPVEIIDDRAGKARLVLEDSDINDWFAGFYRYAIQSTDVTGRVEFLYTDLDRNTFSNFELIEGLSVALAPAIEICSDKFTPVPLNNLTYTYLYTTGALEGDAQVEHSSGMHTVVAYTANEFMGRLCIQASLTPQAPADTDWFNIPLGGCDQFFYYNGDCSPTIKVFNFAGNYYWVRIYYQVDQNNQGQFIKVQYKN